MRLNDMLRRLMFIAGLLFSTYLGAVEPDPTVLHGQPRELTLNIKLSPDQQQWLTNKKLLTLGVSEPEYPPFDMINFNREYVGVTADFSVLISSVLKTPINIKVFATRYDAINALQRREIDFIGTSNGFEADNKQLILSQSYAIDNPVLAGRVDDQRRFPEDLKGVSVAMVYHYLPPEWVKKAYPGITLKTYPSNFSAMGAVAFGESDLFLGDSISTHFLSSRRFFNNIAIKRNASLQKTEFAFAMNRDDIPLPGIINAVLDALPQAEQQRIFNHWGVRVQTNIDSESLLQLDNAEQYWRNSHPVLRVVLEEHDEPFSLFTRDGQGHGVNADTLREIARIANFQLEWRKVQTPAQAQAMLKNGEADIAVVMTDSQKNAPAGVRYSATFYRGSYVVVGRTGSTVSLDNLSSQAYRVALIAHDPIHAVIQTDYPHLQPIISEDIADAFGLVNSNRADVAIVSLAGATFLIENYYKNRMKIEGVFDNKILQLSMAIPSNQPALFSIISKALAAIPPAKLSELNSQWSGQIIVAEPFWNPERQSLLKGFLLLAASFVFLLFWIIWLRSLIKRRDKAERKLSDQLTFMKDLLDGTPMPIYVRDLEGKLLLCNKSYQQQFIGESTDLIGKTVHEVLVNDDQRADELQQKYHRVIAQGEPIVSDRVLRVGDNDYRIIHHWILPYRNGVGEIVGIIAGWYDISERQQRLERLQIDKNQALQASEAKTTFLTTMSHEIRTPMNVIIGMLELAAIQASHDIVDKRSIEIAAAEAQDLLELIGDILDIERAESVHLSLNEKPSNIGQIIVSVCRLFEALSRRKGLRFTLNEATSMDYDVLLDPLRFKQILSNLLSNALKFTEKGEISVSVDIAEVKSHRVELRVSVQDTGIGISPQDSQALFSRFTQASNNTLSSQQSSGLGLLICKTLCEMMGGTLTLSSELRSGTCMTFVLPLDRCQTPVMESKSTAVEKTRDAQRVLIVDDYAANREVLTLQLSTLGHTVISAADAHEALALWQTTSCDLLITDCNMPKMDGYELTQSIRRIEQQKGMSATRIIGLTANALNEEREKCLRVGMDDCLFKPITLALLASLFEQQIDSAVSTSEIVPSLDLSNLIHLTDNDVTRLHDLLRIFVGGIENDINQLSMALSAGDSPLLVALAHRIKGGAEIINAREVIEACEALDVADVTGHSLDNTVEVLINELQVLSSWLQRKIDQG